MPKMTCVLTDSSLNKAASFSLTPKTGWALLKVYAALKVRSAYDNESLRCGAIAKIVRCPGGNFLHLAVLEGKDESNMEKQKNELLFQVLQGKTPLEYGWLAFESHGRRRMREAEKRMEEKISARLKKIKDSDVSFEFKLAKIAVAASGIFLYPFQSPMHKDEIKAALKENFIYGPIEKALSTLRNAIAIKG